MVSRDKRVTLKVTATRKQRWVDYATDDDTEWTDLSDLVRGAVEKEISGALDREAINDLDLRFDTDQFEQTLNESLAEVTDELEAIQGELTTVKDLAADDNDIEQLAAQIYEHLPRTHNPVRMEFAAADQANVDTRDSVDHLEEAREWTDARAWAEYFDEPIERIQRALSVAMVWFPNMEVAEIPTESGERIRCYYRSEETQ